MSPRPLSRFFLRSGSEAVQNAQADAHPTQRIGADGEEAATEASWLGGPARDDPPDPSGADSNSEGHAPGWLDAAGGQTRMLGRYVLGPRLGSGGMGDVHQAWDPTLRRVVALKILHCASPLMLERFRREARLQARVKHPGICQVFEVSTDQDQGFIAMQLIQGPTLNKVRGRLDLDAWLQVFEEVARALQAAHEAQLVHRDLKPGNIMVERQRDGRWQPYVLDFGLARDLEGATLTRSEAFFGTPAFMPPEQARGARGDFRSDIYSLGATCYAALTGQPPIQASSLTEMLRQIGDPHVEPLGRRVVGVPWELETIVMKCLDPDPARRYPTARDLAEDLQRLRSGQPIRARRASGLYRLRKVLLRHKAMSAVTAVALLTVATSLGFLVHTRRVSAATTHWSQHFGQEAERIEALVRYASLRPLHDVGEDFSRIRARVAGLETEIARAGAPAGAPGAYALGRLHLALSELDQAQTFLDRAWRGGLQTPGVHLALGECMGARYMKEIERSRTIADAAMRQARMRELERTLRDPALEHLRKGAVLSAEASLLQAALVALFDRHFDQAIAKAREAFQLAPWFYEAKALEGEALLQKARGQGDIPSRLRGAEDALACFQAASVLAPSNASLRLGQMQALHESLVAQCPDLPEAAPVLAELDRLAGEAQRIEPQGTRVLAAHARVLSEYASRLAWQGGDPGSLLPRALDLACQATTRDPEQVAGWAVQARVHYVSAYLAFNSGGDPSGDLARGIALAEKCASLSPADAVGSALKGEMLRLRTIHHMYSGQAPWEDFREGRELLERFLARYPTAPEAHLKLAEFCVEQAEYERTHGQDPRPTLRRVEALCTRALDLGHQNPSVHRNLGFVALLEGQYLAAMGRPPGPPLERALAAFAQARSHGLEDRQYRVDSAEACLTMAEYLLWRGQSPLSWLDRGEALLGPALAEHAKHPWLYYLSGRLALMRAESGPKPAGIDAALWGRAVQHLQHAARLQRLAPPNVALAEAYWFRCSERPDATLLSRGLACAEEAARIDPLNGNAHLVRGLLHTAAAKAPGSPARRGAEAAKARQAFARALALDGNLRETLRVRGVEP